MIAPRVQHVPAYERSLALEAVELAASAGLVLDDWQQAGLAGGLGIRPDGRWAAREVGVAAPRQNGKGGIIEARALAGLYLVPSDRLQIYSAHLFKTASEALLRLEGMIQNTPELHAQVRPRGGYKHSHGEEGIYLKNGKRILFMTRTSGGGRGLSSDNLFLDEAMFLPEMTMGALIPTLSARVNPQRWYFGSAVDQTIHQHGVVFARIRERGIAGKDPDLAYFEWSLDVDTPDRVTVEMALNRELWRLTNPALGVRIDVETVENEQRSMDRRTFAVERLNCGDWPPTSDLDDSHVVDLDVWDSLTDPGSVMKDPVCFGFDVTPKLTSGAIAAAGFRPDGKPHVEVVEHRPGVSWIPARLAELKAKHRPSGVAYGKDGPSDALAPDLERVGLDAHGLTVTENVQACNRLVDEIEQRQLRHLGAGSAHGVALRDALAGAVQKPAGDGRWLWSRAKSRTDISPLVATTVALYELSLHSRARPKPMVVFA